MEGKYNNSTPKANTKANFEQREYDNLDFVYANKR